MNHKQMKKALADLTDSFQKQGVALVEIYRALLTHNNEVQAKVLDGGMTFEEMHAHVANQEEKTNAK